MSIADGVVLPVACLSIAGLVAFGGYQVGVQRAAKIAEAACLDRCAQSEAACMAVAERMNISVSLPPWQAMVLTPILDPR